jgi:hypothetical protein
MTSEILAIAIIEELYKTRTDKFFRNNQRSFEQVGKRGILVCCGQTKLLPYVTVCCTYHTCIAYHQQKFKTLATVTATDPLPELKLFSKYDAICPTSQNGNNLGKWESLPVRSHSLKRSSTTSYNFSF